MFDRKIEILLRIDIAPYIKSSTNSTLLKNKISKFNLLYILDIHFAFIVYFQIQMVKKAFLQRSLKQYVMWNKTTRFGLVVRSLGNMYEVLSSILISNIVNQKKYVMWNNCFFFFFLFFIFFTKY
jgi:hypothetical protein